MTSVDGCRALVWGSTESSLWRMKLELGEHIIDEDRTSRNWGHKVYNFLHGGKGNSFEYV